MKRKLIGIVLTFCMLIGRAPCMVYAKTNIQIGEYVQMGTYYGEPILWRCVDMDENGYLMLSDKILCIKAFDSAGEANTSSGSHSRNRVRRVMGSNYWGDSNMRSWLNSTASAGNVQWLCGNPPDKDHVSYNAYDQEAGFLSNFTQLERNTMKEVRQKSLLSYYEVEANMAVTGTEEHDYSRDIADVVQNYDTAYAEYVTDKMFLMDVKQINAVYNNGNILGKDYYIGEPTAQCVTNSEYKGNEYEPLKSDKKYKYWLRSPDLARNSCCVRGVGSDGHIDVYNAGDGDTGVRPAFYLADTVSFGSGSGTESKPYTISDSSSTPSSTPTPSPTARPTPKPTAKPTSKPTSKPTPAPKHFTVSGSRVTNTADTAQTATIITATYSGKKLTDITSREITFKANEAKTFTVPTGGKLLVWDSVSGMRPLIK